jgi:hypothetical protein
MFSSSILAYVYKNTDKDVTLNYVVALLQHKLGPVLVEQHALNLNV